MLKTSLKVKFNEKHSENLKIILWTVLETIQCENSAEYLDGNNQVPQIFEAAILKS